MSLIVFSALGVVFVVNADNGKVGQFTALEAIVLSNYFSGLAHNALADLITTGDEQYAEEANDLFDFSDALNDSAVESVFG
jgi:hypothetical protein